MLSFAAGNLPQRISALPGVAHVSGFGGAFVVIDGRLVWLIARPPRGVRHVLSSQIVQGSQPLAERRLSQGGWVVVSRQIAQQEHARIGGRLLMPTPRGEVSLRIAALSSNLAWSSGALFPGSARYRRLSPGVGVTALGVSVKRGASVARVKEGIEGLLRHSGGLAMRSSAALQASIDALTSEGLGQLRQISNLLLFAAILTMAAALSSAVWQRRSALAGLRLCGVRPARLRRILFVEAGLLLSAGYVTGALTGVYGQAIIDGYLGHVTGFPVAAITADARPLQILALVLIIVSAAAASTGIAAQSRMAAASMRASQTGSTSPAAAAATATPTAPPASMAPSTATPTRSR